MASPELPQAWPKLPLGSGRQAKPDTPQTAPEKASTALYLPFLCSLCPPSRRPFPPRCDARCATPPPRDAMHAALPLRRAVRRAAPALADDEAPAALCDAACVADLGSRERVTTASGLQYVDIVKVAACFVRVSWFHPPLPAASACLLCARMLVSAAVARLCQIWVRPPRGGAPVRGDERPQHAGRARGRAACRPSGHPAKAVRMTVASASRSARCAEDALSVLVC